MNEQLLGKICLVTGANTGIGKATTLGLANMGATVVMLCRNHAKGEAAQAEIIGQSGNQNIDPDVVRPQFTTIHSGLCSRFPVQLRSFTRPD